MIIFILLSFMCLKSFAGDFKLTMRDQRRITFEYNDDYSLTPYAKNRLRNFAVVDPLLENDIAIIFSVFYNTQVIESKFKDLPLTTIDFLNGRINLLPAHFSDYIKSTLASVQRLRYPENQKELSRFVRQYLSLKFDSLSKTALIRPLTNSLASRASARLLNYYSNSLFWQVLQANLKMGYPNQVTDPTQVRSLIEQLFKIDQPSDSVDCMRLLGSA